MSNYFIEETTPSGDTISIVGTTVYLNMYRVMELASQADAHAFIRDKLWTDWPHYGSN